METVIRRLPVLLILSLLIVLFELPAHAGFLVPEIRGDLGLGYGRAKLEYGETEFDRQSVAGHVDLHVQWLIFMIGATYMTTSQLNIGNNRSYASMATVNAGFALGRHFELIAGVGGGKWRHARFNQSAIPRDFDYVGTGPGIMGGVRVYLFEVKSVSVGLSATYYRMSSELYTSTIDRTQTNNIAVSRGTGTIAAIVFRWNPKLRSTSK
jgi:hypothetical protein